MNHDQLSEEHMSKSEPKTNEDHDSAGEIFDPARLYHVGICVKNLEEAAKFYEQAFGIGPFWFRDVDFHNATYHGETVGYRGKRGFAQMSPGMMLELIENVDGKTIQDDFLAEKGEGLHHLGFEVDDLSKSMAAAERRGFKITQSFQREDGTGFAYVDSDRVGGAIFEVVQRPPVAIASNIKK